MINTCYDKNGKVIDFYTIFNITSKADTNEIKAAFRNLIKRYHPDVSGNTADHITEKIDLIIRGYRILIDDVTRLEYDRILYNNGIIGADGYTIIPKKRIKYSASLENMLKAQLLPKGVKRKDIIFNFGQDVEIYITPVEAKRGAIAYIELPARMYCPLCHGSEPHCYICKGIGRINTSSQLEVKIPPHVDSSTYIDVDLMKMKPDKVTTFCLSNLRIRIFIDEPPK